MIKRIVAVLTVMLLSAFIAGCDNTVSPEPIVPKESVQSEQKQAAEPGKPDTAPPAAASKETMKITIYSASKDGMFVVPEQRIVPKNNHPGQTAMELLIAGTKTADLVSVVPAGTKLRNINVKDKIAYVDFNDSLIKNNTGGSTSEMLLVAAIVNTLTEFRDIQKVQIMVEGKKIDTISGHMDIGEPLSRSEKIIKK